MDTGDMLALSVLLSDFDGDDLDYKKLKKVLYFLLGVLAILIVLLIYVGWKIKS